MFEKSGVISIMRSAKLRLQGKVILMDGDVMKLLVPLLNSLRQYHRHQVVGMEHIPEEGPAVVVVNHSLATYDIGLLNAAIFEERKRFMRSLADHLFYRVPYLSQLVEAIGAKEGNRENAKELLAQGEMLCVAPGGMREALRPSTERYQLRWERRRGFAQIAIEAQVPVIIAVCPRADDLYQVYSSPLTSWAYRNFKVPLFLARGVGITPIPRPVKLIHHLSEPLYPPKPRAEPEAFKKQVEVFHRQIVTRAERLIGEAIAYRAEE
jgi:1-acyl-sn-glycerol-3-phosphate acyltransferase